MMTDRGKTSLMWRRIVLITLTWAIANAQEKPVNGKVTYLSAGTVYTSIGWGAGVQDSSMLFIVTGPDTVARLKIFAVSSKSCACNVLEQKREIVVGDAVTGSFLRIVPNDTIRIVSRDSLIDERNIRSARTLPTLTKSEEKSWLVLQGRASLQYYSAMFDNSGFNFSQPGMVLNIRATSPDIPMKLDFYGNIRTLARGGVSPFSGVASNASRIYRFSLEYDDKLNDITFGRIIPTYAPSIGSIDGVSYARRLGNIVAGASIGFQPTYNLQGLSTDTRKVSLFAGYQTHGSIEMTWTAAYARTYFESMLDREAVSLMVSAFTDGGLSIYGYCDLDLRSKRADLFELSPSVTVASFNINYRFTDFLTVGVGADASRAVFPFSTVQGIADTLLDRNVRSGATINVNITLMNGVGVVNTFSPRSSGGGLGQDYMNYSAFYLTDAFSTGATVRGTFTMNENEFTSSRGYGINLQRNLLGIDIVLRYQQNRYSILQLNQGNTGETFGIDCMALFSKHFSFVASFDTMRGYGSNSYAIFTEFSWRF